MEYTDKKLTCGDCMNTFPFSGKEQEVYASKGLKAPGRCPECRASHERLLAARAAAPTTPARRRRY